MMLDRLKKFFDITMLKFIVVGIANTIFGMAIMFLFYNLFHFNYWISSASNYIFGSILSYFLNKYFTFQNKSKDKRIIVRFVINITICYLVAYGVAQPVIKVLFSSFPQGTQDNIAMLAGTILFVGLNYLGQRFWAFKKE
ncbi:GtrA containing transmembrane protein [Liquorilactobacillus aquaticus DSM 21051]|uniref:GtrA containing transmembrane protein n=1 Tax=Liquorilactobacillus aquaticus DSM 21051 TaxID=1423725 RepID=A0A0R2CWB9_9LACO|nr:GtrA family protein [Liquorilactobacillus aquaticus]KRM95522.1 GtrA containing transmembrane protein [Liquorilactobacillus aquaticus DSM 21051]